MGVTCKNPQQFYSHIAIYAARVSGTHIADPLLDRKNLEGTLEGQLLAAEAFLRLHLRNAHRVEGFAPESHPELPGEVFREALVNALVHRDYTVRAPLRLLIFDNRVELRTPGQPPNTVDVEAMKAGIHVPRNPIVMSHMAKMGFVTVRKFLM